MMRGVKVGKKKGGEKISVMKVFEKKAAWFAFYLNKNNYIK
jgi:hypothetical protein